MVIPYTNKLNNFFSPSLLNPQDDSLSKVELLRKKTEENREILRKQLTPKKIEGYKKYINTPYLWKRLNTQTKKELNLYKQYLPELFEIKDYGITPPGLIGAGVNPNSPSGLDTALKSYRNTLASSEAINKFASKNTPTVTNKTPRDITTFKNTSSNQVAGNGSEMWASASIPLTPTPLKEHGAINQWFINMLKKYKKATLGDEYATLQAQNLKEILPSMTNLLSATFQGLPRVIGSITRTSDLRTDKAVFDYNQKNNPDFPYKTESYYEAVKKEEALGNKALGSEQHRYFKNYDYKVPSTAVSSTIGGVGNVSGEGFKKDMTASIKSIFNSGELEKIKSEAVISSIKNVFNPQIDNPNSVRAKTIDLYRVAELELKYKNNTMTEPELVEINNIIDKYNALDKSGDISQGTGLADLFKQFDPKSFAEPYGIIKPKVDDNAFQELSREILAGVIGSPGDVAGLALEVYLMSKFFPSGGIKKGANTMLRIQKDIKNPFGKVIFKAGEKIALGKKGKEVFKGKYGAMPEASAKSLAASAKISESGGVSKLFEKTLSKVTSPKGTKFMKNLSANVDTTALIKAMGAEKNALLKGLENLVNAGYTRKDLNMLLDLGGFKLNGKTIVSGFKIQKAFAPLKNFVETFKPTKAMLKLWTTKYGIPEELIPFKEYAESMAQSYTERGVKLLNEIEKDLNTAQRKTFKIAMGLTKEREALGSKIAGMSKEFKAKLAAGSVTDKEIIKYYKDIQKLTKAYEDAKALMPHIDDNIELAMRRYNNELATGHMGIEKEFLGRGERAGYSPTMRTQEYLNKITPEQRTAKWRSTLLGTEKAGFQELYKPGDFVAAMKKGIVDKKFLDVGEATSKRLFSGGQQIGRKIYTDAMKQFGKSATDLVDPLAKSKSFGKVEKTPKDWIPATDFRGKPIPELSGYTFPKEIAKAMKGVKQVFFGDDNFKYTLGLIDKATNIWKRFALFTPGYQMRNFYTDFISGNIEWGLAFSDHVKFTNAIKIKLAEAGVGKYADEIIKIGGIEDTAGNWALKFNQTKITSSGKVFVESAAKEESMLQYKLASNKANLFQQSAKLGGAREDITRIVGAQCELQAGSSLIDAAHAVKKVFFDYTDLSTMDRLTRRFIAPFWTWTRKNIPRQVEIVLKRSGNLSNYYRGQSYLSSLAEKPEGYEQMKPSYIDSMNGFLSNFKDASGNPIIITPNLAQSDINKINPWEFLKEFPSTLSPILKAPLEAGAFKKDIFRNKELKSGIEDRSELAPNILQKIPNKLADFLHMNTNAAGEKFVSPLWNYIYNINPLAANVERWSPAGSSGKQIFNRLSIGAGIKGVVYDEEKQAEYFYKQKDSTLQGQISNLRLINKENPNVLVPTDSEFVTAYRQYFDEYYRKEYDIDEIDARLKLAEMSGASTENKEIIKNKKKPYLEILKQIKGANTLGQIQAIIEKNKIYPDINAIFYMVQQNKNN